MGHSWLPPWSHPPPPCPMLKCSAHLARSIRLRVLQVRCRCWLHRLRRLRRLRRLCLQEKRATHSCSNYPQERHKRTNIRGFATLVPLMLLSNPGLSCVANRGFVGSCLRHCPVRGINDSGHHTSRRSRKITHVNMFLQSADRYLYARDSLMKHSLHHVIFALKDCCKNGPTSC